MGDRRYGSDANGWQHGWVPLREERSSSLLCTVFKVKSVFHIAAIDRNYIVLRAIWASRETSLIARQLGGGDPYNLWQRGLNENTNGPLRQYFPEDIDLSGITPVATQCGS